MSEAMATGKNTLPVRAMKIRFLLRELVDVSRSRQVAGDILFSRDGLLYASDHSSLWEIDADNPANARKIYDLRARYLPGLISTALSIGGDDTVVRASEFSEMFGKAGEKGSLSNASKRMRHLLNQMVEIGVVIKYLTGEPQKFAQDPSGWHYEYALNEKLLNRIKHGDVTLDGASMEINNRIQERMEAHRETQAAPPAEDEERKHES